ncbi:hypothetical protein SLEP1_g16143 [Rubroshorea leprosula]|uniref:PUM-HD domain-containing protein n=1 Tax=Rubroshorea leprosula TaxID=152421 RepID=A0AAV5J1J9_9ROSI|nr:hypothetical protein SLEP1_g16143 [Rubroshorea leprosula]
MEETSPTPADSQSINSMDTLLTSFENLHVNNLGFQVNNHGFPSQSPAPSPSNYGSALWPSCFQDSLWSASTLQSPFTRGCHPSLNAYGAYPNHHSLTAMNTAVHKYDFEPKLQLVQDKSIIQLALTLDGSQRLQSLLLSNDVSWVDIVFEGVIGYIFRLMADQFGHQVFGNLIQFCDEYQQQIMVENLTAYPDAFIEISLDRYGSPSVKRLIKLLQKSPLVTDLVNTLCTGFYDLMIHRTGSHVILYCLDTLDPEDNKPFYEAAISNSLKLATHQNGCLSLNNFITLVKGHYRNQFLEWVSKEAVCLSKDPFGNFVVQHVLDLHHPHFTRKICYRLQDHYTKISMLKGGSHVVEKCLKTSHRDCAVVEFINSDQLVQVSKDQFGNYVIQTALKETKSVKSPLYERLVSKLRSNSEALQRGHGKNVLNLIHAPQMNSSSF